MKKKYLIVKLKNFHYLVNIDMIKNDKIFYTHK